MCIHLQCMLIVHSSTGTYSVNMQSEWCKVYGCNGLNNVQCLLVLFMMRYNSSMDIGCKYVQHSLTACMYLGDCALAS